MHFDDRLATVLRAPANSPAIARIQFRQLIDLLSRPGPPPGPTLDAAYARLDELGTIVGRADRARVLREPMMRLENAELLARLMRAEPDVASAAIKAARLRSEEWLAMIPRLPVQARGILRHRSDLGPEVEAMLERFGIGDRALPAAHDNGPEPVAEQPRRAEPSDRGASPEKAEPTGLAGRSELTVIAGRDRAMAAPAPKEDGTGIGAIVRKIEEYRKTRVTNSTGSTEPTSRATGASVLAMDFATDIEGRVTWADGPEAPALVGWHLAGPADEDGSAPLRTAMRHRQPVTGLLIDLPLAPVIEGRWRVDAVARFDAAGRYIGYAGRLRRPPPGQAEEAPAPSSEADRMRQILHELPTPTTAIQVAAEIIQQQLYGPTPHEYRALAAAIAGDTAQVLAGFEELDRLVKLESAPLPAATSECDLAQILTQTVARLQTWTGPRASGFALPTPVPPMLVRAEADDAGKLFWRLLAALASATQPGEVLPICVEPGDGMVTLSIRVPRALEDGGPASGAVGPRDALRAPSAGIFGWSFALRLATAEAAALGGALQRDGSHLNLSLPGLTAGTTAHRQAL